MIVFGEAEADKDYEILEHVVKFCKEAMYDKINKNNFSLICSKILVAKNLYQKTFSMKK
jgi:hypothetical protein